MSDWYVENIEENLRDLVRFLRNNGVNTECSCHHAKPMYVQCQVTLNGELKRLHDLLWLFFAPRGPVNFEIRIRHRVANDHASSTLEIRIAQDG